MGALRWDSSGSPSACRIRGHAARCCPLASRTPLHSHLASAHGPECDLKWAWSAAHDWVSTAVSRKWYSEEEDEQSLPAMLPLAKLNCRGGLRSDASLQCLPVRTVDEPRSVQRPRGHLQKPRHPVAPSALFLEFRMNGVTSQIKSPVFFRLCTDAPDEAVSTPSASCIHFCATLHVGVRDLQVVSPED